MSLQHEAQSLDDVAHAAARLRAAAGVAERLDYTGLAALLDNVESVLTALPASHAQHIAEALVVGAMTEDLRSQ